MNFFLSDPLRPAGDVWALTGSTPLSRVSSMRQRVHRVRPWHPSTSNNHRCTAGRRFVGSDELAAQSRVVLFESRIAFGRLCQRHDLKIRRNNIVNKPFSPNTIVPKFPNFYLAAKEGHRNSVRRSVIALYQLQLATYGRARACS